MQIFEAMEAYGHEQIVFARDERVGLRAIVAIHSTVLGPALGGTRFWNYATEEEALVDVLRLSRGMTLKNAAAGLKLGGGKAVILGDPQKLKSRAFFHAYGRVIEGLGGKFYTAEDVNISALDVGHMGEATQFVRGDLCKCGDPSPFTARGVYMGMKAGAKIQFGTDSLEGKQVVVQGLGSVGYALCAHMHKEGAKLKVHDINASVVERAVQELGAKAVSAEELLTTEADIFAPCAMGAVLNAENVKHVKFQLVAGAANNILADEATADALKERGILCLPDYIVNAGGAIHCGMKLSEGVYEADKVHAKIDAIYDATLKIIALAKEKQSSTDRAAQAYAEERIQSQLSLKPL